MLTREQITANINALEQQGAKPDEIQQWLDTLKTESAPTPESEKQSFIQEAVGRVKKVAQETAEDYKGIAKTYDIARASGDKTALPAMALSSAAIAPKAVGNLIFEGVKQLLPEGFKADMKSWLNSILTNKRVQEDIVQPITKWAEDKPVAARAVQDVAEIASALPILKGTQAGVKGAIKSGEAVADVTKKVAPVVKEVAETATEKLARTPQEIADAKLLNQAKINKVVNTIVQGETKDIAKAKRVLSELDTSGITSYSSLSELVRGSIDNKLAKVDELFAETPDLFKLKDLQIAKKVGEETVKYNYVNRALNGLQEMYSKTADKVNETMIKQLREKIKSEGLQLQDLNELARRYGTEFGDKAFNKRTGQALTSVNSEMYENIRKGLKETVRSLSPNKKAITALDESASDAIRIEKLLKDMVEKVGKLESKFKQESALMKTGRTAGKAVGRVIDVVSGGTIRGMLTSFLPSNIGNKIMNSVDLQRELRKNLIQINKLNKASGENFFNELNKMLK